MVGEVGEDGDCSNSGNGTMGAVQVLGVTFLACLHQSLMSTSASES